MALLGKKSKKTPKFSSVSVDGTTPVAKNIVSDEEISKKKLNRAVRNSDISAKTAKTADNPSEQNANGIRIADERLKESIEVIKTFLNFPKDAEFTTEMMVSKFLKLIKDYVSLHEKHTKLLNDIKNKASAYGTCHSSGPSWN